MSGIASGLTCVPNWLTVSAVHSFASRDGGEAARPGWRGRPALGTAGTAGSGGRQRCVASSVATPRSAAHGRRRVGWAPGKRGASLSTRIVELVEVVPNFSEGRRLEVVDRLASAVSGTPGVFLLDRTSDASHHRSVLTFAGPAGCSGRGGGAPRSRSPSREIDLERHTGEHPRIGAVDVIPFVPLGTRRWPSAVALARAFGERIARARPAGVPVCPRRDPPVARSWRTSGAAEYEGFERRDRTRNGRGRFRAGADHPSAGAVAVGARPFLIA